MLSDRRGRILLVLLAGTCHTFSSSGPFDYWSYTEASMSDEILAPLITIVVLAGLFLWVPTLHLCDARCKRLLLWHATRSADRRGGSHASEELSKAV